MKLTALHPLFLHEVPTVTSFESFFSEKKKKKFIHMKPLTQLLDIRPIFLYKHSTLVIFAKGFAQGPLSLHPWQIELEFWIHALTISIGCSYY